MAIEVDPAIRRPAKCLPDRRRTAPCFRSISLSGDSGKRVDAVAGGEHVGLVTGVGGPGRPPRDVEADYLTTLSATVTADR